MAKPLSQIVRWLCFWRAASASERKGDRSLAVAARNNRSTHTRWNAKFDPNKNPAYVIFYSAIISAVFTAAIMALHVATQGVVEQNEQVAREKALVSVFDLGDVLRMSDAEIRSVYRRQIERVPIAGGKAFYFAYREDAQEGDRPFAVAIPIYGVGFWAPVEGLLAMDVSTNTCLGVVFTQHSETPGLGGRITEQEFRRQWKGLNLRPPENGVRYVYINNSAPRGPSDPQSGRHVDAISGATGTSTAVEKFANVCIRDYLKKARAMARTIRKGQTHADAE
jgi:Na+-transporting NADH:ubiquinone oxidoreductase subunit C